jgi:hypothetical protein
VNERDHSEVLEIGGYIIIDFREVGWKDVDWMHLSQDRDQWWVLVKTVMNLHVP